MIAPIYYGKCQVTSSESLTLAATQFWLASRSEWMGIYFASNCMIFCEITENWWGRSGSLLTWYWPEKIEEYRTIPCASRCRNRDWIWLSSECVFGNSSLRIVVWVQDIMVPRSTWRLGFSLYATTACFVLSKSFFIILLYLYLSCLVKIH